MVWLVDLMWVRLSKRRVDRAVGSTPRGGLKEGMTCQMFSVVRGADAAVRQTTASAAAKGGNGRGRGPHDDEEIRGLEGLEAL